jgi:hypothetical protein
MNLQRVKSIPLIHDQVQAQEADIQVSRHLTIRVSSWGSCRKADSITISLDLILVLEFSDRLKQQSSADPQHEIQPKSPSR